MDKWTNPPAPAVDKSIQEQLTQLGGVIPDGCGDLSGKPLFLLVWAPDVLVWKHGKPRLRFLQRQRLIKRHYACTEDVFARIKQYDLAQKEARDAAYMRLDLSGAYSYHETTPFIQSNFTQHLDYIVLDADVNPKKMIRPATFPKYYRDVDYVQQVGKAEWKVLRWMPTPELKQTVCPYFSTMLDDPKRWTEIRYGHGFYPEAGLEMTLDLLGPYPKDGAYEHEFLTLNEGEVPTDANVVVPLAAYMRSRDAVKDKWHADKDFRAACDLHEALEEHDREALEWSNYMDEVIKEACPAFKGAHVTVPAMPPAGQPLIQVVRS